MRETSSLGRHLSRSCPRLCSRQALMVNTALGLPKWAIWGLRRPFSHPTKVCRFQGLQATCMACNHHRLICRLISCISYRNNNNNSSSSSSSSTCFHPIHLTCSKRLINAIRDLNSKRLAIHNLQAEMVDRRYHRHPSCPHRTSMRMHLDC